MRRVVLETDPAEVLNKVVPKPTGFDAPLNEQTLSSAISFASQRLKSFLK